MPTEQISRNINTSGDLILNVSSGQYDARTSFGPHKLLDIPEHAAGNKSILSSKSVRPLEKNSYEQILLTDQRSKSRQMSPPGLISTSSKSYARHAQVSPTPPRESHTKSPEGCHFPL